MSTASITELPHQEVKNRGRYSIARALRCLAEERSLDGLEGETSREITRRSGRSPRGVFVPLDVPAPARLVERRGLTTATGAGTVPILVEPTWIDILRPRIVTAQLGAQIIPDLVGGELAFPKKTATVSVGWMAEGAAPVQQSNPLVDQRVLLTPHTTGAFTDVSRKALASIPSIEANVIDDLDRAIGVEVDRMALNGPGGLDQPLGVLQNTAVTSITQGPNGGPPTRVACIQAERLVGNRNADVGPMAWIGSPDARAAMRAVQVGNGSKFLWYDNDNILSYKAVATSNVPNNLTVGSGSNLTAITLGRWGDLIISMWGVVDLIINPYLFSAQGVQRITALLDCDVTVRHVESFVNLI